MNSKQKAYMSLRLMNIDVHGNQEFSPFKLELGKKRIGSGDLLSTVSLADPNGKRFIGHFLQGNSGLLYHS